MKLRRFSKSVAALMTALMLASSVSVPSFAADGAVDEDVAEVVVEEAVEDESEEATEEFVEVATEETVEDEIEASTETVEEILDEIIDEELEEDCDESIILSEDEDEVFDFNPGYSQSLNYIWSMFDDDLFPVALGAPSDYSGLGYFLEKKGLKKQVVNKEGTMALGGLEATIETDSKNNHFLHLKGYYEISLDVWRVVGSVDLKDHLSPKDTNPQKYVLDPSKTTAKPSTGAYDPSKNLYGDASLLERSRELNTSLKYSGPDGTIPVVWKVNGSSEPDLLPGQPQGKTPTTTSGTHIYLPSGLCVLKDGHQYNHTELKVPIPKGYNYAYECYFAEFDYKFDIGSVYTKTYDKVDKVVISEILGVPVHMEVLPNGFYPELVENVRIVDKVSDGVNTRYTIRLDTNSRQSMPYVIRFASGNAEKVETINLGPGKQSTDVKITLPVTGYGVHISSIMSEGYQVRDGKEGAYKLEKWIDIPDSTYNVSATVLSTELGTDLLDINLQVGYNINTPGIYDFTYSYVENAKTKTLVKKYLIKETSGSQTVSIKVPANVSEVKLSNVTSPDGVTKYIAKRLYVNEAMYPEKPTEFKATIKKVTPYLENAGQNILFIGVEFDYEAPTTGPRYLYFAYEKDGEVATMKKTLACKEGYGEFNFVNNGTDGSNRIEFRGTKHAPTYVKLLYIEDVDGTCYDYNQWLYCKHVYHGGACDAGCDICGEVRETAHDYSKDCRKCSLCGATRNVNHEFDSLCDKKCKKCEFVRENLVHVIDDVKNPVCKNCKKTVDLEQDSYVAPAESGKTGWTGVAGISHYLENGKLVTGWKKIGDYWYYFDANGDAGQGWELIGGRYYYFQLGKMLKSWQKVDGKWRFFDKSGKTEGALVTGWKQIDSKWYYFSTEEGRFRGQMKTGWQKIGSLWYYFDPASGANEGVMTTGWKKLSNKWYYFDKSNGNMTTGWKKLSNLWYYFDSDGVMTTGWLKLGSKWYYFDNNGAMVTGKIKIDGKLYVFGADGVYLRVAQ